MSFEVIQQTIQGQIIINCINVQKHGTEIVLKVQECCNVMCATSRDTHKKVLILNDSNIVHKANWHKA